MHCAAQRRLTALAGLVAIVILALPGAAEARGGGGASSFGGRGGGGSFGGGGFHGGIDGGIGYGIGSRVDLGRGFVIGLVAVIVIVVLIVLIAGLLARTRYAAVRRKRAAQVRLAAIEPAEDDPEFAPELVRTAAEMLFTGVQVARSADDRAALGRLCGADLMREWGRRLEDFERRGWHNEVAVMGRIEVEYVGLTMSSTAGAPW